MAYYHVLLQDSFLLVPQKQVLMDGNGNKHCNVSQITQNQIQSTYKKYVFENHEITN